MITNTDLNKELEARLPVLETHQRLHPDSIELIAIRVLLEKIALKLGAISEEIKVIPVEEPTHAKTTQKKRSSNR